MATGPTALVPVTGSTFDDEIVGLACDLMRLRKGKVRVLYVIQVPRSLPLDAEVPTESMRGERVLQHMEQLAKERKCPAEGEILQARNLGPAVVREAEEREVDLLVAGMPYQENYGSPTLGDFIPFLLKHSPCQVLVVRDGQTPANRKGWWR
ncbi:MAG: universal stress protein [Dehalococcoidia bacterium]